LGRYWMSSSVVDGQWTVSTIVGSKREPQARYIW
jgi:hypothetical protein